MPEEKVSQQRIQVERSLLEGIRAFMNRRFDQDRLIKYQDHFIRELDRILVVSPAADAGPRQHSKKCLDQLDSAIDSRCTCGALTVAIPQEAAPRHIKRLDEYRTIRRKSEATVTGHDNFTVTDTQKLPLQATAPDWAMRVARQFCDEAFTEHNPTLVETWRNRLAALIRQAGSERERALTDLLTRLVAKLKVILPKVDGIIGFQSARAGKSIYDGPNLKDELSEASRLLGGES